MATISRAFQKALNTKSLEKEHFGHDLTAAARRCEELRATEGYTHVKLVSYKDFYSESKQKQFYNYYVAFRSPKTA